LSYITNAETGSRFATRWPPYSKRLWCRYWAADSPIRMTIDSPTQNHMPTTAEASKWKPEVTFQYGGCLLSETGNSNTSAADSAILAKFGMQIVLDILKCDTSPKRKPIVDLRRRCRHLGRSICRDKSVTYRLIRINICRPILNHMLMTTAGQKSRPEV